MTAPIRPWNVPAVPLPQHGHYVATQDGFLMLCPMLADGSMDQDADGPNWYNPDFREEGTPEFDALISDAKRVLGVESFWRT